MAGNIRRYCPICKTEKIVANFYDNPLVGHKGERIWICKSCAYDKYKDYLRRAKDEKVAMWCTLAEMGMPFKKQVWKATREAASLNVGIGDAKKPYVNIVNLYMNYFKSFNIRAKGLWESDEVITPNKAIEENEENKNKYGVVDYDKQVVVWGRFERSDGSLDDDAYKFLNTTFAKYVEDMDDLDANLENRYRDLARCELRLRRANEKGDGSEISKAQDSLNKQLALLGLNNFKKEYESEEKRAYEKRVAIVEHTKPAECEDLKKYLDMVGYEKEKALPMRAIRNAIAGTREYPEIPPEEK